MELENKLAIPLECEILAKSNPKERRTVRLDAGWFEVYLILLSIS